MSRAPADPTRSNQQHRHSAFFQALGDFQMTTPKANRAPAKWDIIEAQKAKDTDTLKAEQQSITNSLNHMKPTPKNERLREILEAKLMLNADILRARGVVE
jgi:hypothetical protein